MTTGVAPKAQSSDLISQVIYAIRAMGVASIPRNYQLFYEAYIGSNPELAQDLAALGSRATQEELDDLSARHLGTGQVDVIEKAHDRILTELDSVLKLLRQEQASLESYSRLLGETAVRINAKSSFSSELIRNAVSLLNDATGDKIAQGEKTAGDMEQRSQEMDQVRRELDEYKRIANTDSLTRLSNRRAFDERLATIFDHAPSLPVTALVLADIDNFKKINDSYGHPVGDKILSTVASVIRSNVRKEVFVARTGGEEFAIIVQGNTPDEVMIICERVRRALETRAFRNSRSGINYGPVTISLGYSMASQAADPGDLYARADTALYHAKNSGRNRTVFYEDSMTKDYVSKSWLIYKK
ncbi:MULTISPECIES: GGDEF domain-containing protein [Rhizobium/Agrobacterium group]|jgi:diguanylate cyclase|uniref:GGDEF domain-containing protein n=1 Tax=Rhizobium/Agrobacterium group TaxID=227290 RepID=UPI00071243CB|nr:MULTISPECIES: GGDEF domain-containing protein [Rhizobium/Agrobacterium group]KQQ36925.1 diguanylate cyclase [Rhizobium sp. Leaf306]MBD8650580.1 GGDEF domain-containing protein [Rhizobium sp. CFBP 13726]MBD8662930.1 GGDEF domain-containing protein [Rhizobium sp. CFBP 8752]NSY17951.1 GGDEF domain-containing protein [Neorhizobium sp. AL 9.2.2]SEH22926.1 diguanylate cyclase [Rhizobium sp. NFR12]